MNRFLQLTILFALLQPVYASGQRVDYARRFEWDCYTTQINHLAVSPSGQIAANGSGAPSVVSGLWYEAILTNSASFVWFNNEADVAWMNYDANGVLFASGIYSDQYFMGADTMPQSSGFFLLRYSDINQQHKLIDMPSPCYDAATDRNGNLYTITATGMGCYDINGNELWFNQNILPFELSGSLNDGVYVMGDDSIYYFNSTDSLPVWTRYIEHCRHVFGDYLGNLIVANEDSLIRIDSSNTVLWEIADTTGGFRHIKSDLSGNLFGINGNDEVVKLDNAGQQQWKYSCIPHNGTSCDIDTLGRMHLLGNCSKNDDTRLCPFVIPPYDPLDNGGGQQNYYARVVFDSTVTPSLGIFMKSNNPEYGYYCPFSFLPDEDIFCTGEGLSNNYGEPGQSEVAYQVDTCISGYFDPNNTFVSEVSTSSSFTTKTVLDKGKIPVWLPEGDYFVRVHSTSPVVYSSILPVRIKRVTRPVITANERTFCNTGSVTLHTSLPASVFYTLIWNRNNTFWDCCNDTDLVVQSPGTYTAQYDMVFTLEPGCIASSYLTKPLTIRDTCYSGDTHLKTADMIEADASPNPFGNTFTLRNNSGDFSLEVFDPMGRMIESKQVTAGMITEMGNGWPSGIYLLRMTNGNGLEKTLRMVRQ